MEYLFIKIYIIFIPKIIIVKIDGDKMKVTVGQRLKKLREDNNFTQKQIADYLGFKQTQIAKLENNDRTLKSSSLNKLCELYNCNPEYILEGIGVYSIEPYKFRSNKNNLDLNTLADMNRIIRNLKQLHELNGD